MNYYIKEILDASISKAINIVHSQKTFYMAQIPWWT